MELEKLLVNSKIKALSRTNKVSQALAIIIIIIIIIIINVLLLLLLSSSPSTLSLLIVVVVLLYIILTIYLLIGNEPIVNFGNKCNLNCTD